MKNILNLDILKVSREKKIIEKGLENIRKDLDELNKSNKMKLKFNVDNLTSEIEFNGIRIVFCDDANLFIRKIIDNNEINSKIMINGNVVKNKNICHIHSFSKVSDFINTKNNGIFHEYLKKKDIFKKDLELQNYITEKFFEIKDENVESLTDVDFTDASVLNYIKISNDYINSNNIKKLLEILKDGCFDKQLILINDYNVLTVSEIVKNYLKDFNFVIVTNNLKKWLGDFSYIELIVVINDFVSREFGIDALEILNKNILVDYLTKRNEKNKEENREFAMNILKNEKEILVRKI